MYRLSRIDMKKILDLCFQGYAHEEIARMTGIPRSTISEFIEILPDCLIPNRELAVELRKQNVSVFEAKKGAELRARLDNLRVEFNQLENFVESAEKIGKDPDYTPNQIVRGAMRLNELEKSGRKYPKALVDF